MKNIGGYTKRRFTLIELLVVISIIAILAGLLLPTLVEIKYKGNRTSTINNLRNIGFAVVNYVENHSDLLPRVDAAGGSTGLGSATLALLAIEEHNVFPAEMLSSSLASEKAILTDGLTAGKWDGPDNDFLTKPSYGWNLSYTSTVTATTPVAADDPAHHGDKNLGVILFSDSHVKIHKRGEQQYINTYGNEDAINDDTIVKY